MLLVTVYVGRHNVTPEVIRIIRHKASAWLDDVRNKQIFFQYDDPSRNTTTVTSFTTQPVLMMLLLLLLLLQQPLRHRPRLLPLPTAIYCCCCSSFHGFDDDGSNRYLQKPLRRIKRLIDERSLQRSTLDPAASQHPPVSVLWGGCATSLAA